MLKVVVPCLVEGLSVVFQVLEVGPGGVVEVHSPQRVLHLLVRQLESPDDHQPVLEISQELLPGEPPFIGLRDNWNIVVVVKTCYKCHNRGS